MSFISPGSFLRAKLIKARYDLRSISGDYIDTLPSQHGEFLISVAVVFGKVNAVGELEHLVALKSPATIRKMIDTAMNSGRMSAEDNKTIIMDGKTFAHHMARSRAFA